MRQPSRVADSAASRSPVVGHIGLAEAGNLGDDLILIAVVRAITDAIPGARVRFLSHGLPLQWAEISERLSTVIDLDPVRAARGVGQMVRGPRILSGCSAVVFGGGGLLQTSHHPLRPYHWLRYVGVGRHHPPAVAAGLGLGPLSSKWARRLARGPRYFEQCWVRDDESQNLAQEFGWDARRCSDFVDAEFLRALGLSPQPRRQTGPLGVALRAWPGLDPELVARHVERVGVRHGIDRIEFFVLESKHGRGPDVDFTNRVSDRVRLPTSVTAYDSQNLLEMLDQMMECSAAIAMKLHAAVVWSYAGIETYPVIYAPKVAAHFGLPYRGLQILEQPVRTDEMREPSFTPSAHRVVGEWLRSGPPSGATQAAMRWPTHIALGVTSDLIQAAKAFKDRRPRSRLSHGSDS